jgi:ATP-binding cassette, subfamily B, bacterial HlyB/CyaB
MESPSGAAASNGQKDAHPIDTGLSALAAIAGYYGIPADPVQMAHDLGLMGCFSGPEDLVRSAQRIGLKARLLRAQPIERLGSAPLPAIIALSGSGFVVTTQRLPHNRYRIIDPTARRSLIETAEHVSETWSGDIILLARRLGGPGANPATANLHWFLKSVWRYRRPLSHVMIASLFIQLFALVTPLFFQTVIDKVLPHKAMSTLLVVVAGLVLIGLFDDHLVSLPLTYFETRPTGQTVARIRELETVRTFLTGPALCSALDLLFALIFIYILFLYSPLLTCVVVASVPGYALIAILVRPALRDRIKARFNCGAITQQFLVESVVGIETLKAAAVEPLLRREWEDKLAAYAKTSFQAATLGSLGQNSIQYLNKATTALIIFFGAHAVISGEMTIGALVAFTMIMNQVTAPILRLSQLWQDLQQVQISVDRLGDILRCPPEARPSAGNGLSRIRGEIRLANVDFRYRPDGPAVLQDVNLVINEGDVIGIVGSSGSGKSTLTKLIQRLYRPERGNISIDGVDIAQVDAASLRRQIGVVLQENLLFNRTIHDNIALGGLGLPRSAVVAAAKLAAADEFIRGLSHGYDTMVEERGTNLSAGQRQRIAIARALVMHPRILILDEATSALDYESEQAIRAHMREVARGRTVIVIAHRLAAVRDCNRIVVINSGRIVEQGSHDELCKRTGGAYAKLWDIQLRTMGA